MAIICLFVLLGWFSLLFLLINIARGNSKFLQLYLDH